MTKKSFDIPAESSIKFQYKDEDEDTISITNNTEYTDFLEQGKGAKCAKLIVKIEDSQNLLESKIDDQFEVVSDKDS